MPRSMNMTAAIYGKASPVCDWTRVRSARAWTCSQNASNRRGGGEYVLQVVPNQGKSDNGRLVVVELVEIDAAHGHQFSAASLTHSPRTYPHGAGRPRGDQGFRPSLVHRLANTYILHALQQPPAIPNQVIQ